MYCLLSVHQSNWSRPVGRPYTSWMATLKSDLSLHNLTFEDAIQLALDKSLWRLLVASGATHWHGACRIMMMMMMISTFKVAQFETQTASGQRPTAKQFMAESQLLRQIASPRSGVSRPRTMIQNQAQIQKKWSCCWEIADHPPVTTAITILSHP